jgi:FkbM family methyltransferase
MIGKIIKLVISIIDSQNKKKILNFFKQKFYNSSLLILDVGSHHGETISFFSNNFDIHQIHGFEPSIINFSTLKKNTKELKNTQIHNYGLGNKYGTFNFTQSSESSSSTFVKINEKSSYFKKKYLILNLGKKKNNLKKTQCSLDTGKNFFQKNKLNYVDLLKIDTEGFEFEVLEGIDEHIKKIKFIYFEHHFDDMLQKSYKLSNIHDLLVSKNFKKVFKLKMNFRKAFEYVYENKRL